MVVVLSRERTVQPGDRNCFLICVAAASTGAMAVKRVSFGVIVVIMNTNTISILALDCPVALYCLPHQ